LIKGKGIKRTISMSNTKKIKARRKNRMEKGIRDKFLGSKPHSKGEAFSRSRSDRVVSTAEAAKVTVARIAANKTEKIRRCINRKIRDFFFRLKVGCY
jgi:hypothetical protein